LIEPVTFRIVVKPFDVEEVDNTFKNARAAGIEIPKGFQMNREQQAVDRGTVVSIGPVAFAAYDTPNPLSPGDEIVYARHAGKEVEDIYTKEKFIVINDEDVVVIFRKEALDG
jgi:co-chaperonin GroES (HSP10)